MQEDNYRNVKKPRKLPPTRIYIIKQTVYLFTVERPSASLKSTRASACDRFRLSIIYYTHKQNAYESLLRLRQLYRAINRGA